MRAREPKFSAAHTMTAPSRLVSGVLPRRRVEGNGVLMAVACVLAAILLYLVGAMVYGIGDDDESVLLGVTGRDQRETSFHVSI